MPSRAIADTAAEFITPIRTCMTRAVGGRSFMFPSLNRDRSKLAAGLKTTISRCTATNGIHAPRGGQAAAAPADKRDELASSHSAPTMGTAF
jgi:hypothetical protein